MILDNYVDNRMMKLYEILTNTDFKGNIKQEKNQKSSICGDHI